MNFHLLLVIIDIISCTNNHSLSSNDLINHTATTLQLLWCNKANVYIKKKLTAVKGWQQQGWLISQFKYM